MIFQHIASIILRYRFIVLLFVGIATIGLGRMALRVEFLYEPTPLLPERDSLLVEYRELTKIFGKGENMMVIGVEDPDFFSINNFNEWVALSEGISAIDGVDQVFSIANAFTLLRNNEARTLEFQSIFSTLPQDQAELDSLSALALSLPFYRGLILSEGSDVFLMMVVFNYQTLTSKARVPLIESILQEGEQYLEATGNKLRFSGLPYIRTTLAEMIKSELFMFVMLAILITAIILYLLFRSIRIVAFALLVVGVSVVWGTGFMGILGYEITLLTAIIPPLTIIIGVTNCIYLLNKYHHEYRIHGNKIKALQRMVQKIGSATFLTNLTTAAGFGTFVSASIPILREFAIIAAISIMGVYIVSLLLIPTIFSYLPNPRTRHLQHLGNFRLQNAITRIILTGLYRRKVVFSLGAVLVFIGVVGLFQIRSESYMVDDIPHDHSIHQDLMFFEKHFSGVMPLDIVINTNQPRGVTQEVWLARIDRLQQRLSEYPELSQPVSMAEAIKFIRQGYYNGNPDHYRLPSGFERGFIMSYLPKGMDSNPILNRFVDSTSSITRIMYNVADIGTTRMNALKGRISADIDTVFQSHAANVRLTGGSVIVAKGNEYLINSLFLSLVLAIAVISILIAWMFRQGRMILLSVLPNLIPLIITGAAMGFIGIPLKPSTVIVFSIAFGISVDNSIHFLNRFRQELARTKGNTKASVIWAIRETGISMIYTCIVLFFGFGIFMASEFGGTQSLGLLVSMTLLVALFCNLTILPSILLSLSRETPSRYDYDEGME